MRNYSVSVGNPDGYADRLRELTLQGQIMFKRILKNWTGRDHLLTFLNMVVILWFPYGGIVNRLSC